jgi:hypothetical protein
MKPRSDSKLFKLTDEQQAQLYDWIHTLGFAEAKERLAAPPPDGFELKAHLSSLHAFYIRYAAQRQVENFAEAEDIQHPELGHIFSLAERAVHAGAFQLSTSPLDTGSFRELSRWISTQQSNQLRRDEFHLSRENHELREKRLSLEREKFELNAARLAMNHISALCAIHRDSALDDEDKIRAARTELFGAQSSMM